MTTIHVFVTAGLILMLGSGCRSREKHKGRLDHWDGGTPTLREECNMPADNCYRYCFKREASAACVGCCQDQDYLCNTQQPHSFESCESTP